jgi:4a-hydroxytetrahydrobiopterin dehydratase
MAGEDDVRLLELRCEPRQGELPELTREEIERYSKQLDKWYLDEKGHLRKRLILERYDDAVELVGRLAKLANDEYHHPTITLAYGNRGSYGRLSLEVWTHRQGVLTLNDFVLAAKIDRLWREYSAELVRRGTP